MKTSSGTAKRRASGRRVRAGCRSPRRAGRARPGRGRRSGSSASQLPARPAASSPGRAPIAKRVGITDRYVGTAVAADGYDYLAPGSNRRRSLWPTDRALEGQRINGAGDASPDVALNHCFNTDVPVTAGLRELASAAGDRVLACSVNQGAPIGGLLNAVARTILKRQPVAVAAVMVVLSKTMLLHRGSLGSVANWAYPGSTTFQGVWHAQCR
jgi:hypothetical protein